MMELASPRYANYRHAENKGPSLAGIWHCLLKPGLWGMASAVLLAVYIPSVVRAYWDGFRTSGNTLLKPFEAMTDRLSALLHGDFSDQYIVGTLLTGILTGLYVRFLFREEE